MDGDNGNDGFTVTPEGDAPVIGSSSLSISPSGQPGSALRRCVCTVLTGGYEQLNEQPVAKGSDIDFICFTDDPNLTSDTWRLVLVERTFPLDPVREQRAIKLQPHRHLAGYDISLYIDNSVVLTAPPEAIFAAFAGEELVIPLHSFRRRFVDEFHQVAATGLDIDERVAEQYEHYLATAPEVMETQQLWTGMLIRDHRSDKVRRFLDIWHAHVLRYSRRDQLSIGMALALADITPKLIDIDNHASWFHSWPHVRKRKDERRIIAPDQRHASLVGRLEAENRLLAAKADTATAEAADLHRQMQVLRASTSWRITTPLRALKRLFSRN
jgi:hypothetical protein